MRTIGTLTLVLLALASSGETCNCPMPSTPEEALQAADLVVSGYVVGVELFPPTDDAPAKNRATIHVRWHWKGPERRRFEVWANRQSSACGYPFALKELILVFATYDEATGRYNTSWCDRTHKVGKYGDLSILLPRAKTISRDDPF